MPNIRDLLPPPPWEGPPLPRRTIALGWGPAAGITESEREQIIRNAQDVIKALQPVKKDTQAIYDKVKYGISMGAWPRAREIASTLTNSAGALEGELADIIHRLRETRRGVQEE